MQDGVNLRSMNHLIRQLFSVGMSDVALVGGKAAALGELLKIRMPVPPGFVITTQAYADREMTEVLREQILTAFDALGSERVAVRSSASCEDGKVMSWAGELETYLNVDRTQVIDRILDCWDSLQSDRAKAYRHEHELNETVINVAVIVQMMIPAEVAGVLFTAHPVTGNRQQVVIEAAAGLGEAVVSGEVIPDTYEINKETREVVADFDEEALLNPDALMILMDLSEAIETHFGFPCDIEWAMIRGVIFILQSRPITTLYG